MFDFMDNDSFIIGVEIVFLVLVAYDVWKFYKTRKKEYILNIAMAIGFALWILVPFYTKYYDWTPEQRDDLNVTCIKENNASYCKCINNRQELEYTYEDFKKLDKKIDKNYLEFIKDSEEDCFGDSWF